MEERMRERENERERSMVECILSYLLSLLFINMKEILLKKKKKEQRRGRGRGDGWSGTLPSILYIECREQLVLYTSTFRGKRVKLCVVQEKEITCEDDGEVLYQLGYHP